jgi:hypothetical protein
MTTHAGADRAGPARQRRGFVESVEFTTADFLAHAARLFAAHPITRVTLTDRRPDDLGYGWGWWLDTGEHDEVPEVAECFQADPEGMRLVYPTEADALKALSLACVHYGRQLAGLPEYTPDAESAPTAHG